MSVRKIKHKQTQRAKLNKKPVPVKKIKEKQETINLELKDPYNKLKAERDDAKKQKDFSPRVSSTFFFGLKYNVILTFVVIILLAGNGFFAPNNEYGGPSFGAPSLGDINPFDDSDNSKGGGRGGLAQAENCEELYKIAEERGVNVEDIPEDRLPDHLKDC